VEYLSDEEVLLIIKLKDSTDLPWQDIADQVSKKFKTKRSHCSVRNAYRRYKDVASKDDFIIKNLKEKTRTKTTMAQTAKENREILKYLEKKESIIESLKDAVKSISKRSIKPAKKPKKDAKKRNMTLELMVSDVHYGKKTNKVGVDVINQRVSKMARVTIEEIRRESKNYNVERLVISCIGDIIENADFHGKESTKASEFPTARQVFEAVKGLYENLIHPIAMTGIDITMLCVTGNHDRPDENKTYNDPGEHNLTYVIYKTWEMMAEREGIKNIKFQITKGAYDHTEIYGNILLVEHGDELRNINRDTVFNQISRRQSQIGKIVDFYRTGHWHELFVYSQGKAIGNGSVPGQDSYADVKGFMSEAIQVLNYYVETKTRKTCFFKTFPIYLETL
jgi:hypothetical protein